MTMKLVGMMSAATLFAAAFPATAQPLEARTSALENPEWVRRPTGQDMARVYPRPAMRRNLGGFGVIGCEVDGGGRLTNCVVKAEGPPGEGFGEAALKLQDRFRMKAKLPGGESVGGRTVTIPIRFVVWR